MENRLPIELASDYKLYKQTVTDFYLNIGNCLSFKNGDTIDEDVFFEKYRDYFMGVTYNLQVEKNRENAKDAVNDLYVYFKTGFKKDHFNNENHAKGSLSAYLAFILKNNSSIQYHNKIPAFPIEHVSDESALKEFISEGDNRQDALESMNIIKDQIKTLPENLKDVITLRYLEGLTIEEIAEKLDTTKKVISNRSCQAINLIKNNLGIKIETLQPSISVIQYTLDGKFIKEYPSMNEVRRQTGIGVTSVSKCCEGYTSHGGGYKWEFVKQNPFGEKKVLIKIETKKELKNVEEIEAEMMRRHKKLEERNKNNRIGRI